MNARILLVDVLNHPTFSFNEDYLEAFEIVGKGKTEVVIVRPIYGDDLELVEPSDYIGIVVSGSITAYDEKKWWIDRLKTFIHHVYTNGNVPLLAICMAHELIADMFGGQVKKNSRSELGTVSFQLTEDGRRCPLFDGIGSEFRMQSAHTRDVVSAPKGAQILAYNARSPCQALRLKNLYGLQFHADLNAATLKRWLRTYADVDQMVSAGYLERPDALEDFLTKQVYETQERLQLFQNFLCICRSAAGSDC